MLGTGSNLYSMVVSSTVDIHAWNKGVGNANGLRTCWFNRGNCQRHFLEID